MILISFNPLILLPIAGILGAAYLFLWYFPRQERKEQEMDLKDERDITERFYEDEIFPHAFKRKP